MASWRGGFRGHRFKFTVRQLFSFRIYFFFVAQQIGTLLMAYSILLKQQNLPLL